VAGCVPAGMVLPALPALPVVELTPPVPPVPPVALVRPHLHFLVDVLLSAVRAVSESIDLDGADAEDGCPPEQAASNTPERNTARAITRGDAQGAVLIGFLFIRSRFMGSLFIQCPFGCASAIKLQLVAGTNLTLAGSMSSHSEGGISLTHGRRSGGLRSGSC
jgi:hypothetical protein